MQNETSSRNARILRVVGAVVLASAVIAAGIAVFWQVTRISVIEIAGDPVEVEVDDRRFTGNIVFFPSSSVAKRIRADNPQVRSVTIEKRFPSTLRFTILARKPMVRLKAGGSWVGLDADGYVTPDEPLADMPSIDVGLAGIQMGRVVADLKAKTALAFVLAGRDIIAIQSITINDATSLRVVTRESDILITQNADCIAVADTLQKLLAGFRIKGLTPRVIDLRYSKPVIQF